MSDDTRQAGGPSFPPYLPWLWFVALQLGVIGWDLHGFRLDVSERVCAEPRPAPTRQVAGNQAALMAQQERLAALVRDGWHVR